jgi:hypothetical protein
MIREDVFRQFIKSVRDCISIVTCRRVRKVQVSTESKYEALIEGLQAYFTKLQNARNGEGEELFFGKKRVDAVHIE